MSALTYLKNNPSLAPLLWTAAVLAAVVVALAVGWVLFDPATTAVQ